MSFAGLVKITVQGADATTSPQNITAPGVLAGDVILQIVTSGGSGGQFSSFNCLVATDGEIVQVNGNWSPYDLTFVLARV